MSKIPCNIIRDLMVLYDDHACSEESRKMVQEHIAECEECRRLYQMAEAGLPDISLGADASGRDEGKGNSDALQDVSRRTYKKLKRRITYRHILAVWITLLVAVILSTIWTQWLRYRINTVPPEDIQVTELYELASGDIYCTFKCKNIFTRVNTREITVPRDRWLENYDNGWQEIYFQYRFPFENRLNELYYGNEVSVIFPKMTTFGNTDGENETEGQSSSYERVHKCSSIYYGKKNKADSLLVWEKGQEIEPAPEEIEKKAKEQEDAFEDHNYYYAMIRVFTRSGLTAAE